MDHPNIIKIYEAYQDQENLAIVTEYYSGGELFNKILKQKIFSESQAANYMLQMASAINYLHHKKIVHRDIKPQNMVFMNEDKDSPLILVDFSTCVKFSDNKFNEVIGSLYYLAPEVIDKNYDEKCDI